MEQLRAREGRRGGAWTSASPFPNPPSANVKTQQPEVGRDRARRRRWPRRAASPAMYALHHCQLVPVRAPKVSRGTCRRRRPSSARRGRSRRHRAVRTPPRFSPTFDHADRDHRDRRGGEQIAHPGIATISRARAHGRKQRANGADSFIRSVASSPADSVKVPAVWIGHQECGSTTSSSARGSTRPALLPPRSSRRGEEAHRRWGTKTGASESDASADSLSSAAPMPATSAQAIIRPSDGTSASAPNAPHPQRVCRHQRGAPRHAVGEPRAAGRAARQQLARAPHRGHGVW